MLLLGVTILAFSFNYGHDDKFIDAQYYQAYARYFQGELLWQELTPPYSYRPLTPFFASLLPWDLMVNFAVVNFIFVVLSYGMLYLYLKEFGFTPRGRYVGMLLYAVSFPMQMYMSIPLSDAGGMLFLFGGVYFIKRQSQWIYIIAPLSVLARETNLVLVLIYFMQKNNWKRLISLGMLFSFLVHYLMRQFMSPTQPYAWVMSTYNWPRIDAYLSWLYGIGGMWACLLYAWARRDVWLPEWKKKGYWHFIVTSSIPLGGLLVYSWFVTYFDSRYVMMLYPVLIPLSVVGLQTFLATFKKFPHSKI